MRIAWALISHSRGWLYRPGNSHVLNSKQPHSTVLLEEIREREFRGLCGRLSHTSGGSTERISISYTMPLE
jgi:hypothetical protein